MIYQIYYSIEGKTENVIPLIFSDSSEANMALTHILEHLYYIRNNDIVENKFWVELSNPHEEINLVSFDTRTKIKTEWLKLSNDISNILFQIKSEKVHVV